MVLGDESFYTVTGEEINRGILVQLMINLFNEKYPDANITDFSDGSVIRNILESVAVDIYHLERICNDNNRICFLSTSYGSYLDLFGQELNTLRDTGSEAWGVVTFSIPAPVEYVVTIPVDTVLVSSETGIEYLTNNACEIGIGDTSVDCAIHSRVVGNNCNAGVNTINLFADNPPVANLTVTNNTVCTGGRDSETDENYRQRLLSVKKQDSFGSKDYYKRLGESIDGIHDVKITDSSNTNYTGKIIVNGDDKPLSDSLFALVVSKYTDESNLVYKHVFELSKVTYTTVDLSVEISVNETVNESNIISALTTLFNGGSYVESYNGLDIDESLSKYLILNCIELVDGVVQVTDLTWDNTNFIKIVPDTDTVLKLGEVTITQNIIE